MEEKITKDEMIQRTGKALLKFLEDVVEKEMLLPEEITAIPGVATLACSAYSVCDSEVIEQSLL